MAVGIPGEPAETAIPCAAARRPLSKQRRIDATVASPVVSSSDMPRACARAAFTRRQHPEIQTCLACPLQNPLMRRPAVDGQGVEIRIIENPYAESAQTRGKIRRVPVDPLADVRQSLGAVVHGVHGSRHGEQHLRGADIGGIFRGGQLSGAFLQRSSLVRLLPRKRVALTSKWP